MVERRGWAGFWCGPPGTICILDFLLAIFAGLISFGEGPLAVAGGRGLSGGSGISVVRGWLGHTFDRDLMTRLDCGIP